MKKNIFICLMSLAVLFFVGACSSEANSEPKPAPKTFYNVTWTEPLSSNGSFINNPEAGDITGATAGAKQIVYTNENGILCAADPYSAGAIKVKIGTDVVFCMYPASEGTVKVNEVSATAYYPQPGDIFPLIKVTIKPSGDGTISTVKDDYGQIDRYGRIGYYWTVNLN